MEPWYTVLGYRPGDRPDPNHWRELQLTFDGNAYDLAEQYAEAGLSFVITMVAAGAGQPIKIKQWDSLPVFERFMNTRLSESDVPKLWNAAVPAQYRI